MPELEKIIDGTRRVIVVDESKARNRRAKGWSVVDESKARNRRAAGWVDDDKPQYFVDEEGPELIDEPDPDDTVEDDD